MNMSKLLCNILHFSYQLGDSQREGGRARSFQKRGKLEQSCRGGRAQGVQGKMSNSFNFSLTSPCQDCEIF